MFVVDRTTESLTKLAEFGEVNSAISISIKVIEALD